jgi:hypothetical protein
MKQLKRFHKFSSGGAQYDTRLRTSYYFGGRNQCFRTGVFESPCKVHDVNSMYSKVMRDYLHPVSTGIDVSNRIEKDTCFVVAEGWNRGAFPVRTKQGLDFTQGYGRYHTTIHEYRAALETGSFRLKKLVKTYGFETRISFAEFVDHFFHQRKLAKAAGDKARDLLYKFNLNSAYGKFAQNPENFFDYRLTGIDELLTESCPHCAGSGACPDQCHICFRLNRCVETTDCKYCECSGKKWSMNSQCGDYLIWESRPAHSYFHNVATGASITGAARSVLLRGLACAVDPYYCDTDSIIARDQNGLNLSDTELGAWKVEAVGDYLAIAGKKLYAIYSYSEPPPSKDGKISERLKLPNGRVGWVVKKAHKGARLTGSEILRIAQGETVEYASPVPAYRLDGKHKWVNRKIQRTGVVQ